MNRTLFLLDERILGKPFLPMGCVSYSHMHDFNINEVGKMKRVERNDTH